MQTGLIEISHWFPHTYIPNTLAAIRCLSLSLSTITLRVQCGVRVSPRPCISMHFPSSHTYLSTSRSRDFPVPRHSLAAPSNHSIASTNGGPAYSPNSLAAHAADSPEAYRWTMLMWGGRVLPSAPALKGLREGSRVDHFSSACGRGPRLISSNTTADGAL
ncbi:hypothetical protein IQ07DRAFT_591857 [Pyrenochaeta sp. DS3sAY3a]|nr:hypothetical protein IQ07DRAFT_591857 [Pyrenochaeta sp. DS3sAY3a]